MSDDIITRFMKLLECRDQADPSVRTGHGSHLFLTPLLYTRLMSIGHHDREIADIYNYMNVREWSSSLNGKSLIVFG